MTENSTATVGRAAIDAYLDSVEQALLAAHAPRSDRLQVLQDLESQIADMLAREPSPLTEESVRSVIEKLEPPSHFANTYGNGVQSTPSSQRQFPRLKGVSWPNIAAASCVLMASWFFMLLLASAAQIEPAVGLIILLLWFISVVFTPFALWKAYRQLRSQPGKLAGRGLVLKTTVAYGVLAPLPLMALAIAVTEGAVLLPLGFAALIYLQYALVRRFWRSMAQALPSEPEAPSNPVNGGATSPFSSATPMPAM